MTKSKTISVRVSEESFEFFKKYCEEELDKSVSKGLRSHIEALEENKLYRQFHTKFQETDFENIKETLESADEIDTDYVDMSRLDYERLFRDLESAVLDSREDNYDELFDIVDDLRKDGYQREALLIHSMASAYEE